MYTLKKPNLLIPVFLLLSIQTSRVSAFSFREMFDDMDHTFKNMQQDFKTRFHKQQQLNEEDQALVNKQLETVTKIKPEITKNDNGLVTLAFPIENVDKNKIELSLEHGLLKGIIPLENGYFRFVVHPNFIKCEYMIEIKKELAENPIIRSEESTTSDKITKEAEMIAKNSTMQWKTSNYFTEALPLEIDLSKVTLAEAGTAETKNNKLLIRLKPKSYKRLKIRHA